MNYSDVEKLAESNSVVNTCIGMFNHGHWSKDQMYCHMIVNLVRQVQILEDQLCLSVSPARSVVYVSGEVYEYEVYEYKGAQS